MNQSSDPSINVQHQEDAGRFTAEVDGQQARLDYQLAGKVMRITHTVVPDAIGGRGIAGQLVQAAVDHARAQDWQVRPACSYAESWIGKHPQYADLVV